MKTLFVNLKFLSMVLIISGLTSCGLDTKVKQFEKTIDPVEVACTHPDAITDHPICEEFISACVFYACKNESDPNYGKFLEYELFISNLEEKAKSHSTIIHDSSKCANSGSKIDAVIFSIEPSAAAFRDEYLNNQPEVSIVRQSGDVAKVALPVTLTVHHDNQCQSSVVASPDWSMGSANPVTTVDGKHLYQNLKILKTGFYYLKASSGSLKPACSSKITVTENLGVGKKVVFLNPKPSSEALHSRDLVVQPKVGIVNALGDIVDVDNVDIDLSLYSDAQCLNAAAAAWEATANPVKTVHGISQFDGVAIKAGGSFYFRASSGSLLQDCYGPIKVADRLKFSQNPAGSVVQGVPLAQQPIVAVSHQDNMIAPFAEVPVTLGVYTDAQCSLAAPTSDYSVDNNPVNSNSAGLSPFTGLKFLKEAKYFIRGESLPLLPTECIPVDVGSSITKVVFLPILPSNKGIKDKVLDQQPKVGLVDANDNIIPENGKSVLLTLHSDNACNDANLVSGLSATTNPGQTTAGIYQFAGVKIQNGGVYYLKASSPNIGSSCFGPIEIAQKLKLEQSASAQVGTPLASQPLVKVVLPNNNVLGIAGVPVTYKVYTDAQCTQAANSSQWSMSSVNPVLTNASGLAQFAGVTINAVGTFYSKATTTENLDPSECLVISTNSVAHSLVFAQPYIPTSWVKNKVYVPQPKVEARDSAGMVLPITIPVELSLHTNSDCSSAPLASGPSNFWDVDATPNQTSNGVITFAGFKVYKGGKYYLKAKTSSAGVIPACSFQFIVADSLHFNPAGQATMVQNVPATTDTKVQAVWKIPPSTIHNTLVNGENVTITVFKQVNCTGDVVPSTDWHFSSANPKATVDGDAIFSGLVFSKVGVYYLKATSPNLDPVCSSTSITVTPGAKKVKFINPLPSTIGLTNIDLEKQPKVQILDENGNPVTNDDKEIKITISSDAQCNSEIPADDYSVNVPNPAMTSQGMYQFSGVKIKKGGLFYIKASGLGLEPDCFGPVEIADALAFLTQPVTPHSSVTDVELNVSTGAVRPVNIHVVKSGIPITLSVYLDDKCETTLYPQDHWKVSNPPIGTNAVISTGADGKSNFLKFNFQDFGSYYLKITSPGLKSACSNKFVIQPSGSGPGCMDSLAKNYNPTATTDDCSCIFAFCPVDQPAADSAQGHYDKYLGQCPKAAAFEDTCGGGSCEDKKDPAQAEKNKTSGYKYQCDKLREVYESDCTGASSQNLEACEVLKATYQACDRSKMCSEYGIKDDAQALLALAQFNQQYGNNIFLYNIPDSQFNWFQDWLSDGYTTSFDSLCNKLKYPGTRDAMANSGVPSQLAIVSLYDNYCDCDCEDGGACSHPDAENYDPSSGNNGGSTGSPGVVVGTVPGICSNLATYANACTNNPNSIECYLSKVYGSYCQNKNSACLSTTAAGMPIPACFLDPQHVTCGSACETMEAPLWYCSQGNNKDTQYCKDYFKYSVSCKATGQPPANYNGVFPNVGCNNMYGVQTTACPSICYADPKVGSCDEAKKYIDQYCLSTNVVDAEKCKFYQEYYKYCSNTKFCNISKENWLYPDLISLLNAFPKTVAADANTCALYNTLWSMCSSYSNSYQGSALIYQTCTDFYTHVKSCSSGTPSNFYSLDCSNYNYYVTQCAGKCGETKPEDCKFSACQDPNFEEYKKYLEYQEYCKKAGVSCEIESNPDLCKTPIGGGGSPKSLRPVRVDPNLNYVNYVVLPLNDVLQLTLKVKRIFLNEGFWGQAVDGLNETGNPVFLNEHSDLTFYKDDKCLTPVVDVNCKFPVSTQMAAFPHIMRYGGSDPASISCQLPCEYTDINKCTFIQSYKLKSVSGKESLCRSAHVTIQ